MVLDCKLVQGNVPVRVHPTLPLDDVAMILGNDLAGGAVWHSVPLLPKVVSRPLASAELDESGLGLLRFFPACAVTRAQSHKVVSPNTEVH